MAPSHAETLKIKNITYAVQNVVYDFSPDALLFTLLHATHMSGFVVYHLSACIADNH